MAWRWLLLLGLWPGSVWAQNPAYVEFDSESLTQGRQVWLGTCEGCHGYGIAGAPIPMQPDEWSERLKKPKSVLYQHATEGFFGPDDTMMPARGGNPELTDREVQLAVDYMTALASFYLKQSEKSQ